jgi:inosose dehydratase
VTSINRLAYRTFGDMAQAARDIAAAGYQGIEFFDVTSLSRRR